MEEILKRLGLPIETWIISVFSATLLAIYKLFESDEAITKRKVIRTVVMCLSSALLVPGLLVYCAKVENPFLSGMITGLMVYGFETFLQKGKGWLFNKIPKNDGNI